MIVSLPLALTILFRSPLIQTLSARLVTEWVSENMDREISIESMNFSFFDGLYLSGVKAYDHKNNPILELNSLLAMPHFAWTGQIEFSNIEIDGASFTYGRYKDDKTSALLMFLGLDSTQSGGSGNNFKLYSKEIRLTNSVFRLFDETKSYTNEKGMDYADIVINGINGYLKDFYLINDSVNTKVLMLQAVEKCGLGIQNLSADFSIGSNGLHAYNSKLSTDKSKLDFDLDFYYSSYQTMSEFIDSVNIIGEIRPSELDLTDLGYFSDVMFEMPDKIIVSGSVQGKVNELNGDNIVLEYAKNTSFTGDVYIKGLPDFFDSYISLGIHDFRTSKCDIQSFVLPIEERNIDVPLEIECADNISVTGNFLGYYGNFKSKLEISLPNGKLLAEVNFNENKNDSIYVGAKLAGEYLNIGKILQIDEITAPVFFNADVEIKGENEDDLIYNFKTLISSVGLMGYNFNRIKLEGNYSKDSLRSTFRIGDKNLMADGRLMFESNNEPSLEVNAEIKRVNIDKLGLWNDGKFNLATSMYLKIMGFDANYLTAELLLKNSRLKIKDDIYNIDSIYLTKNYNEKTGHRLDLQSDIADANLSGDFLFMELADNSLGLINYYYPFSNVKLKDTVSKNAKFTVEIKDSRIIHDHFIKGLELEDGTRADLSFDFNKKLVDLNLSSDRVNFYGIDFLDNNVSAQTTNGKIHFNYDIKTIILKDSTSSDKTVLGLDNFQMLSSIGDSVLGFDFLWFNTDTILLTKGLIRGKLENGTVVDTLRINELDVVINNVKWTLDSANRIYFDSLGVAFSAFNISAGNSSLLVNGRYPKNESDELEIDFDKWDISHFDILSDPYNLNFDGIINGNVKWGMIGKNPTLLSNIRIEGFGLNGQYLGKALLMNSWDNTNKSIYLKAHIVDNTGKRMHELFHADGYYYPFNENDALDIKARFTAFKLPAIEAFLESYVSEIKGNTTGEITLKGTVEKPVITGFASINETSLLINYLNTRYSFSNLIVFEENMIHFDKLVLYDTLGNSARISGFLKHHNLSNPWLDVSISSDKLLFFNTTRKMNDLYYGTGILSGDIRITGAPDDIKLDITTSTKQGTRVYLPLDYTTELADKDYIIFIKSDFDSIAEAENVKKLKLKEEKEIDELKYAIDLAMDITPIARINIAMPSDMGSIEAQGTGDLKMEVNSDGDFGLFGEYIVEKGLFHFTIENLVNKRFELVKGGRISWTGDPYTANINIRGLYKVKANLASLGVVIDSSATYKNKVNVECNIILKDQLMNPTIKFEIAMPDLDPDLQRAVYAQLDTTNQAMVNQQMISLLVLGTFSFSNASSINLSSSYYTILTNQLSGMLSQISDDFDIGVNYKPGDNITDEEFEVALSTQLFDDRLIIDGNFGVSYDRSQQNASNIVGDVNIAYKLTADGRWILKAFNHSNVNSWYYYNSYDKVSPYTQGVGIAYRKEFNNLREFFKRVRKKEKPESESDDMKE